MVKRVLVLESMDLRDISLSDDSSSGWVFASASVRVPVTLA